MCVQYDAHEINKYVDYYGIGPETVDDISESFVVRPSNAAPVVWHDEEAGNIRMQDFEFGMVPSYTKDTDQAKKGRYKFANARDDRLMKSRLWKSRFASKRCLIPANGFFEPHKYSQKVNLPGGKNPSDSIPFYFRLKSSDHFAFAGIYDEWQHPDSWQLIRSFSIITTGPNEQMKKIHNKRPRQPTILHPEDFDFWLDPAVPPSDYFEQNIFLPWPDDDMQHWQVSKEIDYHGRGSHIIEPVANPVDIDERAGEQKGLF